MGTKGFLTRFFSSRKSSKPGSGLPILMVIPELKNLKERRNRTRMYQPNQSIYMNQRGSRAIPNKHRLCLFFFFLWRTSKFLMSVLNTCFFSHIILKWQNDERKKEVKKKKKTDEGKIKAVNRDRRCEELDLKCYTNGEGFNFRHGGRRRRYLDTWFSLWVL